MRSVLVPALESPFESRRWLIADSTAALPVMSTRPHSLAGIPACIGANDERVSRLGHYDRPQRLKVQDDLKSIERREKCVKYFHKSKDAEHGQFRCLEGSIGGDPNVHGVRAYG